LTTKYTPQQILALPMEDNDAKADTIGQYFSALLSVLFTETEGFSGKRPFGNSGWDTDVDKALIRANAITGSFDEDGYIEDYDSAAASAIVFDTIAFLSQADYSTLQLPKEPEDWYVIYLDLTQDGDPKLEDYYISPKTEKQAKEDAETANKYGKTTKWLAVKLTKDS
jgi:hypothetical protein